MRRRRSGRGNARRTPEVTRVVRSSPDDKWNPPPPIRSNEWLGGAPIEGGPGRGRPFSWCNRSGPGGARNQSSACRPVFAGRRIETRRFLSNQLTVGSGSAWCFTYLRTIAAISWLSPCQPPAGAPYARPAGSFVVLTFPRDALFCRIPAENRLSLISRPRPGAGAYRSCLYRQLSYPPPETRV